ncbi:hypothetical protein BRI6_2083 [plant metagenome]|uniref:Uncharacterized protein n=1 Tax=plant metagenome TaxID=1297885 RepID=A0A484RR87_9ZZZZ
MRASACDNRLQIGRVARGRGRDWKEFLPDVSRRWPSPLRGPHNGVPPSPAAAGAAFRAGRGKAGATASPTMGWIGDTPCGIPPTRCPDASPPAAASPCAPPRC